MNEESGREFGWDDVIQNDGQEFEPIPEGDYDFVIDKFERSRSSGSAKLPPCNMAVVYFRINHKGREVTIRENYCFDEDTCLANDLFVNAWMPLPKPYREDEEDGK